MHGKQHVTRWTGAKKFVLKGAPPAVGLMGTKFSARAGSWTVALLQGREFFVCQSVKIACPTEKPPHPASFFSLCHSALDSAGELFRRSVRA